MIYCIGHMYRQYFDLTLAKVRVYQKRKGENPILVHNYFF